MLRQKNQEDIVAADGGIAPEVVKEKVRIPGIETLHEQPSDEIGEVLAMILRSRAHVKEVRYVVGEYVELTTQRP